MADQEFKLADVLQELQQFLADGIRTGAFEGRALPDGQIITGTSAEACVLCQRLQEQLEKLQDPKELDSGSIIV